MEVQDILNEKLMGQQFGETLDEAAQLGHYRTFAHQYSKMENAIAVLSDLKADKSYIYYGAVAERILGIQRGTVQEIDTIWENNIFSKVHPDDLIAKHSLELQFFHLLKTIPVEQRPDYYISSKMRMLDQSEEYIAIHHRMFYITNSQSGSLWLALCIYNYSYPESVEDPSPGIIFNSADGKIIKMNTQEYADMLTAREKEILTLIGNGKMSKEIAEQLSISKNTVDRHRQNILEKLRVKNSIEAYLVAKQMNLL